MAMSLPLLSHIEEEALDGGSLQDPQIKHLYDKLMEDLSAEIPEPDYSDSEEETRQSGRPMTSDSSLSPRRSTGHSPMAGQQQQQLHRELAFNQKVGKNLLGQKTELQRAMERHRDQQQRRQVQNNRNNNRSSFELAMEQRLSRAEPRAAPAASSSESTPEFLQVHARMRSKVNASS